MPGGFLDLFGKPPRESACECERSGGMMLGPVLNLVNGPVVGDALKDPNNRIAKLVATEKDDAKVIEEIYLAILAGGRRRPRSIGASRRSSNPPRTTTNWRRSTPGCNRPSKPTKSSCPPNRPSGKSSSTTSRLWTNVDVTEAKSKVGAALTKQADGSILASGKNGGPEVYTVTATTKGAGITAIRLEVLPDDSLPAKGPGRSGDGNFVLNEFTVMVAPAKDPKAAKPVKFQRALADFSQQKFEVAKAIDGKTDPNSGWAIAPQFGRAHVAIFEAKEPFGFADGTVLTITMDQTFTSKQHNIGRFRLSVTTAKLPITLNTLPDNLTRILAVEPAQRTAAQKTELMNYYRGQDAELQRLAQALNEFGRPPDKRLLGAQDVAWALINSPAFLFNH